jgi:hypothetical protein
MALSGEHAEGVRATLRGHIATIARHSAHIPVHDLVEQVDQIRSIAATVGFATVSTIAGRLESALARDVCGAILLCYLDALDDAVTLEPMVPPAQQALLASVALRLGR